MVGKPLAEGDYARALRKAFWRNVTSLLKGTQNELLPFEEVRSRLPMKGQSYLGLQVVEIEKIIGSMGRYRDFDRAFLPRQTQTRDRWVNIDAAHYEDIPLPPVDLYKIGDVYFVRDGNHRVSVARERGQEMIDAYVTEIQVPVRLTTSDSLEDLDRKQEQSRFLEQTRIDSLVPDAEIDCTLPGEFDRLLEHINTHRWYLGKQRQEEVPLNEAVVSWYYTVYLPLVLVIRAVDLVAEFPGRTETDLYLWIVEYQWYRREAYREHFSIADAAREFAEASTGWPVKKLTRLLRNTAWVDDLILIQEREAFMERTRLDQSCPEVLIELTQPGQFDRLLDHISTHRWFLGEVQGTDVDLEQAAISFCRRIYLPLVEIIQEQHILEDFPGRTETDLALWILEHRQDLSEWLGWEVPPDMAAEDLASRSPAASPGSPDRPAALTGVRLPQPSERPAWRPKTLKFRDILVAIDGQDQGWRALDQALVIAKRDSSRLHGLHIIQEGAAGTRAESLGDRFEEIVQAEGISGELVLAEGEVTPTLLGRARWVDLVVVSLNHPPSNVPILRLGSGLRTLIRGCQRPILAVPDAPTTLERPLLAYDGSRMADEALALVAAMAQRWALSLDILTVVEGGTEGDILANVRDYVDRLNLEVALLEERGDAPAATILQVAEARTDDLIVLGGYGRHPVIEAILGSTLDQMLRTSTVPLLIGK